MSTRRFVPPRHFNEVVKFAYTQVMEHGLGEKYEFNYTVYDCMSVAMLYPNMPPDFRLPQASTLALLYNAFADQKLRERERQRKDEVVAAGFPKDGQMSGTARPVKDFFKHD